MMRDALTIDRDTLDCAAREALTRPGHYAAFDDRWYTTHGCVMEWADRGDDTLAESNYLTALDMLNGAVAHDETGASEARGDDVEDTSASHWLVGSLRQLFVRVRDDAGEYTPAFCMAVAIGLSLRDYPLLDESDYSEREYAAWQTVMDDAIDWAARGYRDVDSSEDEQAIHFLLTTTDDHDLMDLGYPDPDYDRVAKEYRMARDVHFGFLADRERAVFLAPFDPMPGQEPLF